MYQIHQKLGQGAFGIVYHLQISSGNEFALKVAEIGRINQDIIDSSTEARLMLKLSHAHLVQCCASFTHSKFIYLVMELCHCGTLKIFLSTRTRLVKETQVLAWLGQIADALRYLHTCRVIHRDLKTDNVFLDDRKNVKVGDLGIARELDYTAQKAGTFIGTFCYMSPEVLQSSTYSFETDIWSLGCCVHEVMTLRQTFAAQSMMEVMTNIMESREYLSCMALSVDNFLVFTTNSFSFLGQCDENRCHQVIWDIPPMPDVYSQKLQDLVLRMFEKEPKNRPDGLEILLAVSKIQGCPFKSGPFTPLQNIEINHKILIKAVQAFELKSSRSGNTNFHIDTLSLQHSENITYELIEDGNVGSVVLPEEQHLNMKSQVLSFIQKVHINQDILPGSQQYLTSKCENTKQEEQNPDSKIKKIPKKDYKLQHDLQVQQHPVFDELSTSLSCLSSGKSVDDLTASLSLSSDSDRTSGSDRTKVSTEEILHMPHRSNTDVSYSEYMDCLARDSQQWLRMKFGLLEKRNQENQVMDDDTDNSVTLYIRAQVVKYNNRKNQSAQLNKGTGS